jgi:hypothetical protein
VLAKWLRSATETKQATRCAKTRRGIQESTAVPSELALPTRNSRTAGSRYSRLGIRGRFGRGAKWGSEHDAARQRVVDT